MNRSIPIMATVQFTHKLTDDVTLFRIEVQHFPYFQPGQFVQLSVPGVGEIPVSFCGIPAADGTVELCVRSVGRVSSALLTLPVGAKLGVRGPLGQGFPIADYIRKNLILVAGGVGIAPIRSLLLTILQNRIQYDAVTVLHGARSSTGLLFEEEIRSLADNGNITYTCIAESVDKRHSEKCLTGLLPELIDALTAVSAATTAVALCAPQAAYPIIIEKLRRLGIDDASIYLSLERHMKCGVGQCGHCAIGSLLCCTDGPVFSLSQLSAEGGGMP